jgi:hypothetical protein
MPAWPRMIVLKQKPGEGDSMLSSTRIMVRDPLERIGENLSNRPDSLQRYCCKVLWDFCRCFQGEL